LRHARNNGVCVKAPHAKFGACRTRAGADVCDGVDNDCDGQTDEGFVSIPTTCGVGACASTGATACENGQEHDSCTPGAPAADDATCDGIDDDCDGSADEDYTSRETACGVGACASTGTITCVNGSEQDSCMPAAQPEDFESSCANAIDDDCDGVTDDGDPSWIACPCWTLASLNTAARIIPDDCDTTRPGIQPPLCDPAGRLVCDLPAGGDILLRSNSGDFCRCNDDAPEPDACTASFLDSPPRHWSRRAVRNYCSAAILGDELRRLNPRERTIMPKE
jgi:hypothetical protein